MRRWATVGAIVVIASVVLVVLRGWQVPSTAQQEHQPAPHGAPHASRLPALAVEPGGDGTLRLEGRILGPEGQPVAGADVWIDSLPQRTAKSDADGAFAFDRLIGRSYEVHAKSGGLVGGPRASRLDDHTPPIVIRLREGAHVGVTVVDAANAPIAGAAVRIAGEERSIATDARGEAVVTAIPGTIEVDASADGYAPRRISITVGSGGVTGRLTIVLHRGFSVVGRVVDEAGAPIANVRIYARQVATSVDDHHDREAAVSDSDGMFTIPAAVGMHELLVVDDDHAPTTTPPFDVDRAISGLEIVMRRGGVYAGTVVDGKGAPIAGARVVCEAGPFSVGARVAISDDRGAFELRGLPHVTLVARAELAGVVSDEARMDLAEQPELRGQKLVLHGAADRSIAGVVVDDTGAPVLDAVVNATLDDRTMPVVTATTTDAHGQFVLTDLQAGTYLLWTGASNRAPSPPPPPQAKLAMPVDPGLFATIASAGDDHVRIVTWRTGGIRGKVVFADSGAPVPSFKIWLYMPLGGNESTSGEAGVFTLAELPPATYGLRIAGPGFVTKHQKDVTVVAGKTTDAGTITVQRGRTVTGTVIDSSGRPVPGARVELGQGVVFGSRGAFDPAGLGGFELPTTIADERGAFSFGGVDSKTQVGPMSLAVAADHPARGRSLPVAIPSGAQDPPSITLVLRDCGSIAGKVMQNGKPLGAAIIGVDWPELASAITTVDGSFAIPRVPAGTIELRTIPPSEVMRSYRTKVRVEAGKQTDVTIDVPVGTVDLVVTMRPLAGQHVAAASLYLLAGSAAFDNYAQLTTQMFTALQGLTRWTGDPAQPAKLVKLTPGEYTLCTLPLAFSPDDRANMKRVQENRDAMKVYCSPVHIAPAPAQQAVTVEVPAMSPLPP